MAIYAEGRVGNIVYSVFEDSLDEKGVVVTELIKPYEEMEAYKFRVEHFLKEHINHLTISKLRTNKPLTSAELSSAAKQEFSELLGAVPISATQIKFINKLIDHLTVNGIIEKAMLVQPPFTDINDKGVFGVFSDDQVGKIVSIIDRINGNAERVMAG